MKFPKSTGFMKSRGPTLMTYSLLLLSSAAWGDVSFGPFDLISKTRVSRTVYEYSYHVHASNPDSSLQAVSASVTSNSPNTTILTPIIQFGDMPNGASVIGTTILRLRHDRAQPFSFSNLVWVISPPAPILPPDPGAAGQATLEGIDTDQDGVRDDLQRFIVLQLAPRGNTSLRAFNDLAAIFGTLITTPSDESQARIMAQKMSRSIGCIFNAEGDAAPDKVSRLQAEAANSYDRALAYMEFGNELSGSTIDLVPDQTVCDGYR